MNTVKVQKCAEICAEIRRNEQDLERNIIKGDLDFKVS